MDIARRLTVVVTIIIGGMTWWLVEDKPVKWFAAGCAVTAIVFLPVVELRRRSNRSVSSAQPDAQAARRPLTYNEVMIEDARKVLQMNREQQQQTHDLHQERARQRHGLDKK